MSRGSHTADYEVMLHITGWSPGYGWSIRIGVEGSLLARGFDGHLEIVSVRELPPDVPILKPDLTPSTPVEVTQDRKRE